MTPPAAASPPTRLNPKPNQPMIQPTQLPTVRKSLMATTTQSSPWLTGIIAGLSLTAAHGADWNGSSSSDWNTAASWTPGGDPNGAHAIVNTNSPNRAIINANMSGTPIDINVGSVSGSNTRLDHLTGNGQTGAGNWMFVGRGGGTGVYNLANTAGTGGPLTGFSAGTGSMNVRGRLIIGGENSAGSIGTVNVHTSGTLTVRDNLLIGTGNATSSDTGTLNIDSGLMTTGNWTEIGRGGANCKGYINISGGRASASSPAAASSPPSLAPTDSSVSATTMAPRVSWKSPAPTRSSTSPMKSGSATTTHPAS
jgi:fibronectin-binding autotransporter adhesin